MSAEAATVESLRPNVTHDEALKAFGGSSWSGAATALMLGPLQSIADLYIPFWIYRARIRNAGVLQTRLVGMDAVSASLDLYEFPSLESLDDVVRVHTRNRALAGVEEAEARERLKLKVERLMFQSGFFKMRDLEITLERLPKELHVPYWVGFYGRGATARIRVMDAVRRRMEGGRARRLVLEWLTR